MRDTGIGIAAGHAAPRLRPVRAGGPRAGPVAGRAGHRPDAGQAAWWRCTAARSRPTQRRLGQGSEFVVRLPALRAEPDGGDGGDGEARRSAGPARRVLVVDDNLDAADSPPCCCGCGGTRWSTTARAPAAVRDFRPEVVLLDIGMPGMDGYEVAQQLRAQPGLGGGAGGPDRVRPGRGPPAHAEAGFDDHLTKPPDPTTLPTRWSPRRRPSPTLRTRLHRSGRRQRCIRSSTATRSAGWWTNPCTCSRPRTWNCPTAGRATTRLCRVRPGPVAQLVHEQLVRQLGRRLRRVPHRVRSAAQVDRGRHERLTGGGGQREHGPAGRVVDRHRHPARGPLGGQAELVHPGLGDVSVPTACRPGPGASLVTPSNFGQGKLVEVGRQEVAARAGPRPSGPGPTRCSRSAGARSGSCRLISPASFASTWKATGWPVAALYTGSRGSRPFGWRAQTMTFRFRCRSRCCGAWIL